MTEVEDMISPPTTTIIRVGARAGVIIGVIFIVKVYPDAGCCHSFHLNYAQTISNFEQKGHKKDSSLLVKKMLLLSYSYR